MEQIELGASKREILGKKVRFLRRQGVTPAHLFGHGVDSEALQCETGELRRVLGQAGRSRLISLKLGGEASPRNVVLREVQLEPRTGELLHVDFYEVSMAEKVKVDVPLVLVGEAPALKMKENSLVQELNTLSVECLPANIPARVEVDITPLAESDQAVRVKDIKLDEGVAILIEPEIVVARISVRRAEKEEAVVEERVEEEAVAEAPAEEPEKEQ